MSNVYDFPANRPQPMTVGDLRRAIKDMADEMPVVLEVYVEAADEKEDALIEDGDVIQVNLLSATREERCDEVEALYCSGNTVLQ